MVQLNEIIQNKKLAKLVRFLADDPLNEFSYTEIRKQTKLAKATLTKWLSYLQKNNFVLLKEIGRNKLYKINKDNYLIKQFKIINNLIKLNFLAGLSKKYGFEAYLFGSAARGEDVKESDYDLLVIGDVKIERIIGEISKQAKKLKKEIRLQPFTKKDWLMMSEKDPAFYERVENDKILVK